MDGVCDGALDDEELDDGEGAAVGEDGCCDKVMATSPVAFTQLALAGGVVDAELLRVRSAHYGGSVER